MGHIEGDHERKIHVQLKQYRLTGEWFVWKPPVREILRAFGFNELPRVKNLPLSESTCEEDYIAEAERYCDIFWPKLSGTHFLANALESTEYQNYRDHLAFGSLDDLNEFSIISNKYPTSEDLLADVLDAHDGVCLSLDRHEKVWEHYGIGTGYKKTVDCLIGFFFMHKPKTLALTERMNDFFSEAIRYTDQFEHTGFCAFYWNPTTNTYECIATDIDFDFLQHSLQRQQEPCRV